MFCLKTLDIVVAFIFMAGLCKSAVKEEINIEQLFDGNIESEDQSAVVEYLEYLAQNPLDLNDVSAKTLSTIPWISTTVAVRIVGYRQKYGAFADMDDLKNVKGVAHIFEKVRPFLTVSRHRPIISVHAEGRHRLVSKVEESKAFQQNIYNGSREKVLNRLKISITEFMKIGLLGEKDSGEQQLDDLRVGQVLVDIPVISTQIMAGHFSAEFGQGLVFWGPYKMSKGSDPITPGKQRSRGLYPYLSVAENEAFYGVGISSRFKRVELDVFTSRNKKDARIENGIVLSQPVSGLHRTESEARVRDQLQEDVSGAALEISLGQAARFGATLQLSKFNFNFPQKGGTRQYNFTGMDNQVVGIFGDFTRGPINIFGEAAQSKSGGRAGVAGLWCDMSPFELVILYRYYDINFHNFHAFGFGERDETRNENGFYFGIRYKLERKTTFSFFLDQFKSPWPQTFVPMPGSGYDLLFMVQQKFSSNISILFRMRAEKKSMGKTTVDDFGNDIRYLECPGKANFRLQFDYRASRTIQLRTRVEFSSFQNEGYATSLQDTIGTFLYQDIRWQPHSAWRFQTRFTFFDAPYYGLRFYQFENDLPGVMRLKMLNGRGKRWYVLVSYRWDRKLQLHLKYENTFYDDRFVIGSGHDVIYSQYENVLSFQMDWRF